MQHDLERMQTLLAKQEYLLNKMTKPTPRPKRNCMTCKHWKAQAQPTHGKFKVGICKKFDTATLNTWGTECKDWKG
jgi:hypothetical protein